MLAKFKKGLTVALATTLCLATVGASAAEWRVKDYNTSGGPFVPAPIVYQEYDEAGLPTGRLVEGSEAQAMGLKGFAEMSLNGTWVSDVYPNAEFIKLYADGNYTGRVFATGRVGEEAGVEYRDVDFMWEVQAPYRIYAVKQAKLMKDGVVQWFADTEFKNYPVVYSGKNASVASERKVYGFGDYKVTGANTVEIIPDHIKNGYMEMSAYADMVGINPVDLAPEYVTVDKKDDCDCVILKQNPLTKQWFVEGYVDGAWVDYPVSAADAAKLVCVCEHEPDCECEPCTYKKSIWPKYSNPKRTEIAYGAEVKIPRTYEHVLTGPSFDADGNQTQNAVVINSTEYAVVIDGIKRFAPEYFGIQNLVATENSRLTGELTYCDITWTKGGYEFAEPHRVYEFLTVDGVVMDGSKIGVVAVKIDGATLYREVYKPYIYRYNTANTNLPHKTVVDSVVNGQLMVRSEVSLDGGATYVTCGKAYGVGVYPAFETMIASDLKNGTKTATDVYTGVFAGEVYRLYEVDGVWYNGNWDANKAWAAEDGFVLEPFVPEV